MYWSRHGGKGFVRYVKFGAGAEHEASNIQPHLIISALSPGRKVILAMDTIYYDGLSFTEYSTQSHAEPTPAPEAHLD